MNISHIRTGALLAGCLLALVLPACKSGPQKYKVTGKVTKGGQVLKVDQMTGKLIVRFDGMDEPIKDAREYAVIESDGASFNVPSTDRKGLLPGKYRVVVQQFNPFPQDDKLKGQFGEGKSPIIREVKAGDNHFEIDLDKEK